MKRYDDDKPDELRASDVRACFQEIYSLVRKGQYIAALDLLCDKKHERLNKRYKIDPNHAWYNVGDIFFHQGEYRRALDAFKKALRTRRDDIQALWAVGECYSEIAKPQLAERYFRKALDYQPKDKNLIYNLGNALFDQGKYQEALEQYKALRKRDGEVYELAKKNIAVTNDRLRVGSRKPARIR